MTLRFRAGRQCVRSARKCLWLERLEDRLAPAGMTLVTHGFGDGISGWVTAMANAVIDRTANPFRLRPK